MEYIVKAWVRIVDNDELKRFAKLNDVYSMLSDFASYLRGQAKHGDPPDDIEKIYETFWQTCNDYAIDPWED
jgi:hypothetical protein